jgi:uncharacterized protein YqfA (UPF0365 family)
MADALKSGNLGVMDYMNIQNITADTDMRDSISKISENPKDHNNNHNNN